MTTCTPTNQRAHGSHEFLFSRRKSFSRLRLSGHVWAAITTTEHFVRVRWGLHRLR